MSNIHFSGIMPALITPLDARGKVRFATVKQLIDDQLAAGVTGFYAVGGTGEGVLLNMAQRKEMAEAVVSAVAKRGKIIIHTGSINSEEAMELTRHATCIGADGVSSVPPSFYFKYNIGETVDFYKHMADNTDLPLLVYANTQTGANVDVNCMMKELLKIKNIIGAKDTRGNYFQMWQLKQLNGGDVNVINGPDESLLCGLMVGADGGIGATYGMMPELFVELYRQFKAGNITGAQNVQNKINRIIDVVIAWADGNVMRPIKESLRLSGYDSGAAVYPAQEFSKEMLKRFRRDMESAGYVYPASSH